MGVPSPCQNCQARTLSTRLPLGYGTPPGPAWFRQAAVKRKISTAEAAVAVAANDHRRRSAAMETFWI